MSFDDSSKDFTWPESNQTPRSDEDFHEILSRDNSSSLVSHANSGDSWFIRSTSKVVDPSLLGIESTSGSPRHFPGSAIPEDKQSQEILRAQRLQQQRRMMEDKVAHHLQVLRHVPTANDPFSQHQSQHLSHHVLQHQLPHRQPLASSAVDPLSYSRHNQPHLTHHKPSVFDDFSHSSSATPFSHHAPPMDAVHSTNRMIYQVQFKRLVRFYTMDNAASINQLSMSPGSGDVGVEKPSMMAFGEEKPPVSIPIGEFVIVSADRGEDLGIVTGVLTMQDFVDRRLAMSSKCNIQEEDAVIGTLLRVATLAERQQLPKKSKNEETVVQAARDLAKNTYHLPLIIHDADYQFDGHKVTIFYSSDARVDFRDYVRDLFALFKTRIWMKKDPRHLMLRQAAMANNSHNAASAEASFSLLGYVFNDQAAVSLLTGMQMSSLNNPNSNMHSNDPFVGMNSMRPPSPPEITSRVYQQHAVANNHNARHRHPHPHSHHPSFDAPPYYPPHPHYSHHHPSRTNSHHFPTRESFHNTAHVSSHESGHFNAHQKDVRFLYANTANKSLSLPPPPF